MEIFIGLAIVVLIWIIVKASKKSEPVVNVPNTYKQPVEPEPSKDLVELPEIDKI